MTYTFDGPNKRIVLGSGSVLDVRDLYSRWKDWSLLSDNTKYLDAFSVVGGDPIDLGAGIYVTSYFFLQNGWRVRPAEASYTLTVENGILLTSTGADPFIPTVGSFNVLVRYSQPVKSETIDTGGTGGGITVAEVWQNHDVEEGLSPEQMLRLILSAVSNKLSINKTTGIVKTRDVADTKDRLVVLTDEDGQRLDIISRDAS